jgi:hypothetical protein
LCIAPKPGQRGIEVFVAITNALSCCKQVSRIKQEHARWARRRGLRIDVSLTRRVKQKQSEKRTNQRFSYSCRQTLRLFALFFLAHKDIVLPGFAFAFDGNRSDWVIRRFFGKPCETHAHRVLRELDSLPGG